MPRCRGKVLQFNALRRNSRHGEALRRWKIVPFWPRLTVFWRHQRRHLANDGTLHMTLDGKTPNEVYFKRRAANAKPRIETRPLAKHSTPCAAPRTCIAGRAGAKVKVRLEFLEGRRHLPIIKAERIWFLPGYQRSGRPRSARATIFGRYRPYFR